MIIKLISIEWTRLTRRDLFWVTLAACALYIGLSISNFYGTNQLQLMQGALKMPGVSFDLANSLDQLNLTIPFLVITAGILTGSDYSQRTNQHWLMRAPRGASLLAKFIVLAGLAFLMQVAAMLVGGGVGFYYKYFVYHAYSLANLSWVDALLAPCYMTLVNLPYIALAVVLAVAVRPTFFSVALGLGYTQVVELLLAAIFRGSSWVKWLFTNLHFSATFLLNAIGYRAAAVPAPILAPMPALAVSAAYTLILLSLAAWLYRRQDVGG